MRAFTRRPRRAIERGMGRHRGPGSASRRQRWWQLTVVTTLLVTLGVVAPAAGTTGAVSDPSEGTLDDVPSITPSTLGDLDLSELQYGDPAEALDLVQPPEANVDGSASFAHPLDVPPGRADVAPDLALTYDSNGGSGWVGTGWDLSVGAVTVDTTFGAPRYLEDHESETYALDGDRLFPNAIRTELEPRDDGPRSDWVRQTEDDHDLIIRHGDTPSTYCWEVVDTDGNHNWYGGEPDGNGGCARAESAILTAPSTGVDGGVRGDYHWALTYVEDISGNTMRYSYEELDNVAFGQAGPTIGVSLYLREITYTGFTHTDDAPDHPAYRVRFLRDGDVEGETARRDVSVDAATGQPVVTRDLLRRVEVDYLSAAHYDSGAAPELVKGWTLEYENGPFDKALLTRVGQFGSTGAGTEHAWHEFDWYDDVTAPDGSYAGFGEAEDWGNGDTPTTSNLATRTALGTSYRGGGDGGSYIGFNPIIPGKLGSFGGSFNIAGGQSNEVSTLVDLNGDGLPDKVYIDGSGTVVYRPNLRHPGATNDQKFNDSWFGSAESIDSITSLGISRDLRIDLHFEAYPVASIQVGGGFGFGFGDRYFEDVNGDGRVDFIQPGSAGAHTVYYNVLKPDGRPVFIESSKADDLAGRLEVPLDSFTSELAFEQSEEVTDLIVNTSPRVDTVRRWLPPHDGTIRIQGAVDLVAGGGYQGDGAQVSIEQRGAKAWEAMLNAGTPGATHDLQLDVTAGEPVWFRLHVIDNAANDEVAWDPTVTYLDGAGAELAAAPDANGRSQVVFDASDDFTLFGRLGNRTTLAEPGPIDITVSVEPLAGLSDHLDVTLLHGHGKQAPTEHEVLTVAQKTTDIVTADVPLTIAAPTVNPGPDGTPDTDDDFEEADYVEVWVKSDSPVDPSAFAVDISTSVTPPTVPDEVPDDVDIPLEIPIVPNVPVFARTDHTAPYEPVASPDLADDESMDAATVSVELNGPPLVADADVAATLTSQAVLTVKTLDGGVVQRADDSFVRSEFTIEHTYDPIFGTPNGVVGSTDLEFTPEEGTEYYIDVSVVDQRFGAAVDLTSSVTWKWTDADDESQSSSVGSAAQLHWPDVDGMFPSGNRGWAYAGYNADHADSNGGGPLVESQFTFSAEDNGYDEDTDVPTADEAPSAADVKADVTTSFESAWPYIAWGESGSPVADRWRAGEKETLHGTGTTMQADRLGADTAIPGLTTDGRPAPQMLSVNGDFNFMLGLIASFTAAAGGGRELKGYEDYNGDGFPDIRSGGSIEYTGPRGARAAQTDAGDNPFDLVLALGGGIEGSAIATSSSGSASKNNDGGGDGSNVEPTSTKSSRGMNVGLGFDINAQWTNPINENDAESDDLGTLIAREGEDPPNVLGDLTDSRDADGTIIDRAFIDVNGDGLPDRVDTFTSGQMWVNLNLGYRFAGDAIQWSTGRSASNKDVGGSVSLGFQINAYEFGGGVSYSEGVGYSLFDWTDIDGDGVPDRMDNVGDGQPGTVFGSGDGMQHGEVVYGTFPNGHVEPVAQFGGDGIPLPDGQMNVSRSTGLTGGVDFTISIGPICVVACYIIINPGVHGGYDRMWTQVGMVDMNGDGYVDAVKSTADEDIDVRLNQRRRTNRLRSVTNPLGGQIRVDYERVGNTIENPESVWVMNSVEVDDGRAGDGVDVQRSEFTYAGNEYDPLLRELLGFTFVREEQIDEHGNVARAYERDYLNGNPSETGTLIEERTLGAAGAVVQRTTFDWTFLSADPNPAAGEPAFGDIVTGLPEVGESTRTLLFDRALSPRLVTETITLIDGEGDQQTTSTHYTYNQIGDPVTVLATNETEVPEDDTFTAITYSDCAARGGARQLGPDDSWVSVPQTVTVHGGSDASAERLKYRNGGPDLCANAVPVRIAELISEGGENPCGEPLFAITELSFDTHGSYNGVAYPSNTTPDCGDYPPATVDTPSFDGCGTLSAADDAARLCVDYTYDPHRLTDVAVVTDNHGISSSAGYDPYTGRLASRTDENDNVTSYTYDAAGRLASITAPKEQGASAPTVSYAYGGLAATLDHGGAHAWSVASHHDVIHPNNTIDTVTFVDGIDRVVQRKRDSEVDGVPGESRTVEGAVEFNALGREIKEWYPVVETDADFAPTAYNTWNSELPTVTTHVPETAPIVRTWTTLGSMASQTLPDGSVETIDYDFDVLPDPDGVYSAAIMMSRVRVTDPLDKLTTSYRDVGGAEFLQIEHPRGANDPDGGDPLAALPGGDVLVPPRIAESTATPGPITTAFEYDRLGRLTAAIDAVGARTEHTYTRGDAIAATDTPDAGLIERNFAPAGQIVTAQRNGGAVTTYSYDRERLVGVTYSDDTPDVTYEYGPDGAADNAAGRVDRVTDGSAERTYGYDADGNVDRETATRNVAPFANGAPGEAATWETFWEYDSLGRIIELTYPDGEVLAHDYDLGARPSRLVSQAPQHDLYDQYGNTVPRPDAEIVYVDEVRYDQFGEATYLRTGTGVETHYEHEPTRRFLAGITTDAAATEQFDGTMSEARPLQDLDYTYDAVGNVRDTVNGLYRDTDDASIADVSPPPVNNVPGASHQSYTYDGHYRLTGSVGTYIDRKENRGFEYGSDYAPNGNLAAKRQVTTTTGTTGNGKDKGNGPGNPRGKKGDGTDTDGTTDELTCETNHGSGGGTSNQDPETTFVVSPGDYGFATDTGTPDGVPIHRMLESGKRAYTYDANGNRTGWVHDCGGGNADISRIFDWDAENRLVRVASDNNDTEYRYYAEGELALERGPGGVNWFVNEHWRTFNDGLRYANVYLGEQMVATHRTSPADPPPPPCTDTDETTCECSSDTACLVDSSADCEAGRVYDAATGTCQPGEERKLYFRHVDLQGSTRVVTDEVGRVHQYVDYLPNGEPWVAGQNTIKDTPNMFAGGWTDRSYGLVNFGERWYDAREEGFLSTEPLLGEDPYAVVDTPSMLAAYTYAASSPMNYVDRDGRAPNLASTGFDLGNSNNDNHQKGDISISVAKRAKREAPAITFGGRYSNNANGQQVAAAFQKWDDRVSRFTTILSISTEDGVRKIRVFGITAKKQQVGDKAAPDPGPGDTGASQDDAAPQAPAPAGKPAAPAAAPGNAAANAGAGDAGAAKPPAGAGAGGNDAPSPPPPPAPPPAAASPAAKGPDSGQ